MIEFFTGDFFLGMIAGFVAATLGYLAAWYASRP